MTNTALVVGCVCFVLGYLTGRLDVLLGLLRRQQAGAPQGFFAKNDVRNPSAKANIEIDERKVVTEIRTDTLHKTQNIQLGKQVVASDDINASVSKLASLKRS